MIETVDDRTFGEKVKSTAYIWKCRASRKAKEVKDWAMANPQTALMVGSAIIGGGSYIGKKAIKAADDKRQIRMVECRHYDPRTGENWFTRRPLNSKEQLKLDRLYKSGLSKGEILEQMRLLK